MKVLVGREKIGAREDGSEGAPGGGALVMVSSQRPLVTCAVTLRRPAAMIRALLLKRPVVSGSGSIPRRAHCASVEPSC